MKAQMKHLLYPCLIACAVTCMPRAHAYVDQACMNQCTQSGGGLQWCQNRCQLSQTLPSLPTLGGPQPDRACMNQCTARGSSYAFCQGACQ